jgi:hypothetical protein
MDSSSLKSAQLLEQMRLHLATDTGKELTKKVGLVHQLNIAPKVRPIPPCSPRINSKLLFFSLPRLHQVPTGWADFLIMCGVAIPQKLGIDEEIFVVDLKKGEVTKGLSFHSCTMLTVATNEYGSVSWMVCFLILGPYQGKPDATFSFTDNDFLGISTGKTNPQIAFIKLGELSSILFFINSFFSLRVFCFGWWIMLMCRGAIKIKGSISAAQKFTPDIFPKPAKL